MRKRTYVIAHDRKHHGRIVVGQLVSNCGVVADIKVVAAKMKGETNFGRLAEPQRIDVPFKAVATLGKKRLDELRAEGVL